jgi:hypothetical protein
MTTQSNTNASGASCSMVASGAEEGMRDAASDYFERVIDPPHAPKAEHLDGTWGACRTDPKLLALLDKAAKRRITPMEVFEQRVSWCWGILGDESGLTKDQVRQMIFERYGEPSAGAAVQGDQHE